MTTDIRPLTQADMAQCATIINDWIDTTEWMPRELSREKVEDLYDKAFANGREGFAADDDGLQGYILYVRAEHRVPALYVRRGARSRGIGSQLIAAVKGEMPDWIELTCYEKNLPAQAFYRRLGFRQVDHIPPENDLQVPELKFRWEGHG